jgi:hypothetical protein
MTIAQAKHPHPRRLEGAALLVRSTHSYRFATVRFATPRNAPFDRSVGLPDRPFGFGQPTARPIRFGSPWITINTRDNKKPDTRPQEQIEMTTMERLLEVEKAGADGTILEEIELICAMTGFRSRFLVHHMGEGFFRSVALGPS